MKKYFLVVFACLSLLACEEPIEQSKSKKVRIANIQLTDAIVEKEYPARLRAFRQVEIRNRIRAYMEAVMVEEGAEVQEGQPLFKLSSKVLEEQVSKARAMRSAALAELNAAELEAANAEKLLREKVIGKPEAELFQRKAEVMRAKAEDAELSLKQAEIERSYCLIKAPFSGRINRILHREGSLVEEGTTLTSLTNGKVMFAYFYIPEKRYLQWVKRFGNKPNLPVRFRLADGQMLSKAGIIDVLESEVDAATGTVGVRARIENSVDELLHGASLTMLVSDTLKQVFTLPYSGLVERQGRYFVYQVNQRNQLERLEVNLLGIRDESAFLESNHRLKNARIVSEGAAFLREGEQVTIENQPEKTTGK